MADRYYRGQGKVYLGLRDTSGNPKNLRYVGNCPELKMGMEVQSLDHKESWSGQNLPDVKSDVGKSATCAITFENFSKENMAIGFRGEVVTVASGDPVTGETLGAGSTTAVVGDILLLSKRNVSAVTIKDSTAVTPKVLTANTNYKLHPKGGHIELLDLTTGGAFTQPFKADFTPGASTEVGMFTAGGKEYFLRFEGLNTLDSNEPVIIDLYRVQFDPSKTLDMIMEDLAKFPLEGACLMDSNRPSSSALGQFGAIYNL